MVVLSDNASKRYSVVSLRNRHSAIAQCLKELKNADRFHDQMRTNANPPKITAVVATPVSIPTSHPCAWSFGTGFGFTRTVLELTTDDGVIGLGEYEGSAAAITQGEESIGKQLFRQQGERTYFDRE